MSLRKSDKGDLPQIEQISKPLISINESDFKENQPSVTNYPWDKSKYLDKRLNELEPLIDELVEYRPQFSSLQVIGKNPLIKETEKREEDAETKNFKPCRNEFIVNDTWVNPKIFESDEKTTLNSETNPYMIENSSDSDPFVSHPDVIQAPVFGPCIIFGGQTAKWTGSEPENLGLVALESRLNFETKAGKRVLATFEIVNIGTSVIYYDWKKINENNPFDLNNSKIQRFYFDSRSNVIMPGDLLKLHIVFKSTKGGIFSEKWEFVTQPRLLSAASLILTLRGVAIQEDKYKKTRVSIEKKLFNREAEIIANSIIELILSGVRTLERSPTPQDAYFTEEDTFTQLNPDFYYDHETLNEMKKLYLELFDESQRDKVQWDLSINNFKAMIMSMNELDPKKQEFLFKLNSLVNNMCFPSYSPNYSKMYSLCYNEVCQTIDNVSSELIVIKSNLSLPILINEDYPYVDEFNFRYEEWKKDFEIFKQIENEKKNRQEKEKIKNDKAVGKKGAAPPADKKDDKKKDAKEIDRKKVTPTPSGKTGTKSREQMSRSASRAQDKYEDTSKTPMNAMNLTDEQLLNKKIFAEKAYVNVYQMLCKMVDNIESMFSQIIDSMDLNERLANVVNQPRMNMAPVNSDFID